MRILFILMMLALGISDGFGLETSLAPGLSIKNATLYLTFGVLMLNSALYGGIKFQMRPVFVAFATLIAYAGLTWLAIVLVIKYPRYEIVNSAIILKTLLVDAAMFYAVAFYGAKSNEDAKIFIKAILAAVALANFVSILDVTGIVPLDVTEIGTDGAEAGRVFGAFGHANETAALIVCLLPAYIAATVSSRGVPKLAWISAGLICVTMLVLTGSRGGFIGLVVGGIWGGFLCRRFLSMRMIGLTALGLIAFAAVVVPILSLSGAGFGSTFIERVAGLSLSEGGSGRTDIWAAAIGRMMASSWALITGFGWRTWMTWYYLAAHNHYLWLWFELGLVGVICFLVIIWNSVSKCRAAASVSEGSDRQFLTACVLGLLMVAIAVFFTLMTRPWPYIWAFAGASCRIAVNVLAAQKSAREGVGSVQARSTLRPAGAGRPSVLKPS